MACGTAPCTSHSGCGLLAGTRARGRLIKEIQESFTVDAFIVNATDWEKVCLGNLVGMPLVVVPTGFKNITDPPKSGTRRRTTIRTGIYAPPNHHSVVFFRPKN